MIKHAVLNISSSLQWHNLATNTHLLCPLRSVPFALAWFFQNSTLSNMALASFSWLMSPAWCRPRVPRVCSRVHQSCLLLRRFDFSRKHASSICKARESGDENSRDSQGVFHAGTTQYFSSGALPEINLWSRCKGELFYFCLNCCYQTGSDPGDRASQAWSSLIIEGKWFVLFMVDYAFDVSIFTCILYHYCSLVFYLMTIMDIMK